MNTGWNTFPIFPKIQARCTARRAKNGHKIQSVRLLSGLWSAIQRGMKVFSGQPHQETLKVQNFLSAGISREFLMPSDYRMRIPMNAPRFLGRMNNPDRQPVLPYLRSNLLNRQFGDSKSSAEILHQHRKRPEIIEGNERRYCRGEAIIGRVVPPQDEMIFARHPLFVVFGVQCAKEGLILTNHITLSNYRSSQSMCSPTPEMSTSHKSSEA